MINFFRKYLFENSKPKILVNPKRIFPIKNKLKKKNYIIKRNRWHGMFSNLHYVIKHIIYAKKKNYSIFVDMENFPTIYNEKIKVNKTYNAWGYYFKKYYVKNLDNIYKKKNYKFSDEISLNTSKINSQEYKEYKTILASSLINKSIIKKAISFKKKYFKNKKIIGIHFRGSDQKRAALHPFPPTFKQVKTILDNIIKKDSKIFLVTEEKKTWEKFKYHYKENLIEFNSFRHNGDIFSIYPRKLHRYSLGYENLVNMILLSEVDHLVHSNTNFSAMSTHFAKKKIKQTIIFNGYNSKNIFLANVLWYFKSILPERFGGFKTIIKIK